MRVRFKRAVVMGILPLWLAANVFASSATNEITSSPFSETNASRANLFHQPTKLAELLALPDTELEKVDFALIDLLCAEGLQGAENLNVQSTLDTLNQWAAHVENETRRSFHLFQEQPEKFKNSLGYYRMAMMATVLVQDMRMRYISEREKQLENGHTLRTNEDEKAFFGDSNDVFLHGLISGKHVGTSASMPYLYVAMGRRLGYPVTLATTTAHFYVRYEEGDGKHFNVEATEHRAFLTPSDEEYKNPWGLPVGDEEIKGMRYLQPLSNKEVIGHTLLTRAEVLQSMGQFDKQTETWTIAARYLPDTPRWKDIQGKMVQFTKDQANQERRKALWKGIAQLYVPHGAGYTYFQNKKVQLHLLLNNSVDLTAFEKAARQFEDELGAYVKPFIESGTQPLPQEPETRPVLRYTSAKGNTVSIPADFLPPFEKGIIPLALRERVADKNLEDQDSILTELWTYFDELSQARRTATRRQVIQNGTGQILVAREAVPREYWDSVPEQLQLRLAGLNNPEEIISETWAYHQQEKSRKESDSMRARMLAQQQALDILRRIGITPNPVYRQPASYAEPVVTDPVRAEKQSKIPPMYREWIKPEHVDLLSPGTLFQLRQNERSAEAHSSVFEMRQQMEAARPASLSRVRFVPSQNLGNVPTASQPGMPDVSSSTPLQPQPKTGATP